VGGVSCQLLAACKSLPGWLQELSASDCSKRAGPPTLDWTRIQSRLIDDADTDFLIILDCCHASQAARERVSQTVELLAACGMGCRTPGVGKHSFTQTLIKAIRTLSCSSKSSFSIRQLHAQMSKAEYGLRTTPVLFSLGGSGDSIRFPRIAAPALKATEAEATYKFTVSVSERPSMTQVDQISRWLRSAAPPAISSVEVHQILLRTKQLLEITRPDFTTNSSGGMAMDALRGSAAPEIQEALDAVDQLLLEGLPLSHPPLNRAKGRAETFVQDLSKATEHGLDVLSDAALVLRREDLMLLRENQLASPMGILDDIDMLLSNMDGSALSLPQLTEPVHFPSPPGPDRDIAAGQISSTCVLVEYIDYQPDDDGGPPKRSSSQIQQICALLARADPTRFHILPCLGAFHDTKYSRYGAVFQRRSSADFQRLSECYDGDPRPSLDDRAALAHSLAECLFHFHRVEWLHHGLRSEKIIIFGRDYAAPVVLGFDHARSDAEVSVPSADFSLDRNIYKHPDRWGYPVQGYTKLHDLYSLVRTLPLTNHAA